MRNPLAAHPAWRQLLIVAVLVPLLIVLAVLAFAWPAARLAPRNLPVGVVGSGQASEQLAEHLAGTEPGAFDLRLYPDAGAARSAIRHREVYGAFDVTGTRTGVLVAGAAGPAVAQLLTTVATQYASTAAASGSAAREETPVSVVDVVPLSRSDPKGLIFSAALLPLTICSIIVGAVVGVVLGFRPSWRQLVALAVLSAVAGLGCYLVAQSFLGALPHAPLATWASLALIIASMSATCAGFVALVGVPGLGLAAALTVFIGNPSSGATSAPELLPGAIHDLGQWLPPGAGAGLLRSAAYFHGFGAGGHLGVLLAWTLFGFAAIVVGHHGPIRFAASRRASLPAHAEHTEGAPAEPAAVR